mmetsp:Transcript_19585/g.53618  ORF Transcript_19585/g.53618 Transcript_19585/m.53618 type:complete len:237 (+) Transcript_19585:711-1421(+)
MIDAVANRPCASNAHLQSGSISNNSPTRSISPRRTTLRWASGATPNNATSAGDGPPTLDAVIEIPSSSQVTGLPQNSSWRVPASGAPSTVLPISSTMTLNASSAPSSARIAPRDSAALSRSVSSGSKRHANAQRCRSDGRRRVRRNACSDTALPPGSTGLKLPRRVVQSPISSPDLDRCRIRTVIGETKPPAPGSDPVSRRAAQTGPEKNTHKLLSKMAQCVMRYFTDPLPRVVNQ